MNGNIFQSITFKLIGLGLLSLLMLIPLGLVSGLRSERESRRSEAENSIATSWGAATRVVGPVLAVPNRQVIVGEKTSTELWTWWYVLPEKIDAAAAVHVSERSKGIYRMPVYEADVTLRGHFAAARADIVPSAGEMIWSQAELLLPLPDPRGLRGLDARLADGKTLRFTPTSRSVGGIPVFTSGTLPLDADQPLAFDLALKQAGTRGIDFLPTARVFAAGVHADWPDPDYFGAVLPRAKPAGKPGTFAAEWQMLEYNRSFPSVWSGDALDSHTLDSAAFGVRLYSAADVYQQNERSTKYGLLFIALTFGVFFLFETLQRLRVHPVQYLLIGTALATFYLVLLAGSEHIAFGVAYLLGAGALVVIVGGYCSAVLRSKRRGLGIALWLALLYGVLFVLITREDFALLMGAGVVLLLIAATMFLTRKVDWYALAAGNGGPGSAGGAPPAPGGQ
jgi:inner membrane protein